jgi:hypothetical protein
MAFRRGLQCGNGAGTGCVVATNGNANVFPLTTRTLFFSDNVAMSVVVGFTWDGAPMGAFRNNNLNPDTGASGDFELTSAHYSPLGQVPVFANLQMYKCARVGMYSRGNQMHVTGAVFADTAKGGFFAYNQVLKDSIFVAYSANHDNGEFAYHFDGSIHGQRRTPGRFAGIRIYDGPWVLGKNDYVIFSIAVDVSFYFIHDAFFLLRCYFNTFAFVLL